MDKTMGVFTMEKKLTSAIADKNLLISKGQKEDTVFYDILKPPFKIYGLYEPLTEPVFRRIPESVAKGMSDGAHFHHANTTGGRVRFKTDSPYISVRAKMGHSSVMPHEAMAGSLGFDVYADGYHERALFPPIGYDGFTPVFSVEPVFCAMSTFALPAPTEDGMRDITVYMPLYSSVDSMEIGVSPDAKLPRAVSIHTRPPSYFTAPQSRRGAPQPDRARATAPSLQASSIRILSTSVFQATHVERRR